MTTGPLAQRLLPRLLASRAALKAARDAARDVAIDALDSVYPQSCCACECDAPSASPLCERCLLDLEDLGREPACPACGKPVADSTGPCPWCDGRGLGRIKQLARLALMEEPLRTLIHHAKFHGRWELADWLGHRLADTPAAGRVMAGADLIVPVPLHAVRHVHRGYNQAERIARALRRRFGTPLRSVAVRVRPTAAQTALTSVAARQANVRDAFVLLDPPAVAGRHVVLVDDVTTTGATLRSMAECLHAARPASISAAVVALADPRGRGFERV